MPQQFDLRDENIFNFDILPFSFVTHYFDDFFTALRLTTVSRTPSLAVLDSFSKVGYSTSYYTSKEAKEADKAMC